MSITEKKKAVQNCECKYRLFKTKSVPGGHEFSSATVRLLVYSYAGEIWPHLLLFRDTFYRRM